MILILIQIAFWFFLKNSFTFRLFWKQCLNMNISKTFKDKNMKFSLIFLIIKMNQNMEFGTDSFKNVLSIG